MNRRDDNENNLTENAIKIVSMGSEIGHLTMMTERKRPKVNLRKTLKLKHDNDKVPGGDFNTRKNRD